MKESHHSYCNGTPVFHMCDEYHFGSLHFCPLVAVSPVMHACAGGAALCWLYEMFVWVDL